MTDIQIAILDSQVVSWGAKFIALAVLLQTVELLQLRHFFGDSGIWDWRVISREFETLPRGLRWFLDRTLANSPFVGFLWLRLALSVALLGWSISGVLLLILAVSTLLICIRWRGTFNGGSDYMTLIVLVGLGVASLTPDGSRLRMAALAYIAVQAVLSYFIAGWVKLRNGDWRSGHALPAFLAGAVFSTPRPLLALIASPGRAIAISWLIIAFECSFPLALLGREPCMVYIGLALVFHLINAYIFGLNRFVFAWFAAYPALFWFASKSWGPPFYIP